MRKLIVILIACVLSVSGIAQSNKKMVNLGDEEMTNGNYASAVFYYSKVLNKLAGGGPDQIYHPYSVNAFYKSSRKGGVANFEPPKNATGTQLEVLHKLADAYRLAKDYDNAEKWYAVAVESPREENPYDHYFYGVSLMNNNKYEEAKVQFNQVLEDFPDSESKYNQLALDKLANCEFALNPANDNKAIDFVLADTVINGGSTSFGMMYKKDGYIFSSARKDSIENEGDESIDEFNSDLYFTKRNPDGTFQLPEALDIKINSPYNEGAAVVSPDGRSLFFTRVNPLNRNESAIYVCRRFNGVWLEPFKLGGNINAAGFRSTTPYLCEDGTTLYYSSNRPGGEGGMDIWQTTINEDGETTEPKNLGSKINTVEDEITPFLHTKSKTLYFASEGHIGFGGYDIYKSTINPNTDWWKQASNAGAPINSARDDSYYIIDASGEEGFVSSDREDCAECDSTSTLNVHCNQVYTLVRPEIIVSISGFVINANTDEPIPFAKVSLKDVRGLNETMIVKADETGYYETSLILNEEYFMKASKPRFFADAAVENTLGLTESTAIQRDFFLSPIPTGEIEIKGIEYDFDKATLRPISKVELDKLVEFLNLNANLKVEIRSHTDARGSDSYNLRLSKDRAKSVVDYLIANGIDKTRLEPLGLGETEPAIITDENGKELRLTEANINAMPTEEKREEYHQRNRRTAFKVLAEN